MGSIPTQTIFIALLDYCFMETVVMFVGTFRLTITGNPCCKFIEIDRSTLETIQEWWWVCGN